MESAAGTTGSRTTGDGGMSTGAHQAPAPPIRAVLFDLDGTLYPKVGLRALMAVELALLPLTCRSIGDARTTWRLLSGFRRIREELRSLGDARTDLAIHQYTDAGRRLGVDAEDLAHRIDLWIHRRPLKYMRLVRRRGLIALMERLRGRGLRLGVFSDYPATDKLEAMGGLLAQLDLVLDAEDDAVSALKPHPKGLLEAARRWKLSPDEVLYVGDRPAIDGAAAARAGMPCAILSRRGPLANEQWVAIRRLGQIEGLLDARDDSRLTSASRRPMVNADDRIEPR